MSNKNYLETFMENCNNRLRLAQDLSLSIKKKESKLVEKRYQILWQDLKTSVCDNQDIFLKIKSFTEDIYILGIRDAEPFIKFVRENKCTFTTLSLFCSCVAARIPESFDVCQQKAYMRYFYVINYIFSSSVDYSLQTIFHKAFALDSSIGAPIVEIMVKIYNNVNGDSRAMLLKFAEDMKSSFPHLKSLLKNAEDTWRIIKKSLFKGREFSLIIDNFESQIKEIQKSTKDLGRLSVTSRVIRNNNAVRMLVKDYIQLFSNEDKEKLLKKHNEIEGLLPFNQTSIPVIQLNLSPSSSSPCQLEYSPVKKAGLEKSSNNLHIRSQFECKSTISTNIHQIQQQHEAYIYHQQLQQQRQNEILLQQQQSQYNQQYYMQQQQQQQQQQQHHSNQASLIQNVVKSEPYDPTINNNSSLHMSMNESSSSHNSYFTNPIPFKQEPKEEPIDNDNQSSDDSNGIKIVSQLLRDKQVLNQLEKVAQSFRIS